MRYNLLTKFNIFENQIHIKIIGKEKILTLEYNKSIEDLLLYLEDNIYINEIDILDYNINNNIIELFILFGILVPDEFNSGIESLCFNNLIKNPNGITKSLSSNDIDCLYSDVESGIVTILNTNIFVENKENDIEKIQINFNSDSFNKVGSVRLVKSTGIYDLKSLLSIIKFIFEKREILESYGINRSFFKYGSGGGINSVFPILITNKDELIIYEKFNGKFYTKLSKGLFNNFVEKCMMSCNINFKAYNYYIILCSYTKNVFKKYGNKGYKLILLETGEISYLFRLLFGCLFKPHVELQGFFDNQIENVLLDEKIFRDYSDVLINHVLAVSN